MNKFDRVIATLVLLQSKRVTTAAWLSDHFGVSIRTIYRDVQTLKTAGIPVIGDPGTGYSILDGYRLPPAALSRDEALALLTAGKLIKSVNNTDLEQHYQAALTKLRAVLHGADQQALANLEEGLTFQVRRTGSTDQGYLQGLLASVAAQQAVRLCYQRADGTPSERVVEPIGCYHYYGRWYLAAYCRKRADYRTFVLYRIQQFWALHEGFEAPRQSLKTYLQQQQQQWKDQQVFHDIELLFSNEVLNFVDREKHHYGVVHEEDCAIGRRISLLNNSLEIIARWLITYSNQVQVVRPLALHYRMQELATELYEHYHKKAPATDFEAVTFLARQKKGCPS